MAKFEINVTAYDSVVELLQAAENSEKTVNDILHSYAAEEIKKDIKQILPVSGRNWKGKKTAASATMPFKDEKINLGVWVKNKPVYGYLYFVDDGENTRKHIGNMRFMERGAEAATPRIVDRVQEELIKNISG